MVGIRSALALVVVVSVLLCPTLGSHVSKVPTMRIDGLTTCQPPPLMARFLSSEPHRPRNVSRFSQFRYRTKIVLVETTNPTAEEFDLGPAIVPRRLIRISPLELTFRRLAAVHPLRC
jgi:hypothetical protein